MKLRLNFTGVALALLAFSSLGIVATPASSVANTAFRTEMVPVFTSLHTFSGTWLLRNSNTPGAPDITISYGGAGDVPVVGDWDGNNTTTNRLFHYCWRHSHDHSQ